MSNMALAAVLSARGFTPRQFQVLTHIADASAEVVLVDVHALAERVELSRDDVMRVVNAIIARAPRAFTLARRVEARDEGDVLLIAGHINWREVSCLPHAGAA